jgi:hypothetical protein
MKKHQRTIGKTQEWLTPPVILAPLGTFDLDPCNARDNPFFTAVYSYYENGLELEWKGKVGFGVILHSIEENVQNG